MPDHRPRPFHTRRMWRAALCAAGLTLTALGGAASAAWKTPPVPERPNLPVDLPAPPVPESAAAPTIPADLLKPGATITLAEVVDVALRNNPVTRASYLAALSAAAQLGSKRAPYYPTVSASASFNRTNQLSPDPSLKATLDTYGPGVTLGYLLLDLGGRAANVDDARFGLIAADWSHNATIQNVILGVETTYVEYVNAKAQLEAARANVKTAEAALEVATVRHDAGVGTIADVLQAKTALSQARLSFQTFEGQVLALRGSLATAMGLPANTPYDVGALPAEVPLERGIDAIEQLIATARARRPDLAASRALVEKADAHVRAVRSEGCLRCRSPRTQAARTTARRSASTFAVLWSARLLLTFPLFTGFETATTSRRPRRTLASPGPRPTLSSSR